MARLNPQDNIGDRMKKLFEMYEHAYLKLLFAKLNKDELTSVVTFIKNNQHYNSDVYADKCNKWFLDQKKKPKHHIEMWAIVSQCN